MGLTVFTVAVIAVAAGRPAVEQAVLVAAVIFPAPTMAVVLVLAARAVRSADRGERRGGGVLLLVRLSGMLQSGSTLRASVAELAGSDPDLNAAGRLAAAGRPMFEVVTAMKPALGRFAELTGASVHMAARTGGRLAPVVEQLAAQVMALDDLARERRSAMAPALLQAVIVGGVPVVALGSMLASGRFVDLLAAGPVHAGAALVGAALVIGGVFLVVRITRSAAG